jgi:hypothetical protein
MEIAARITRGEALPGGMAGPPRGVVICSAEDGAADTIVPRLIAAGADLHRVYILHGVAGPDGQEDTLSIPGALDVIEAAILAHDAALVIIDPLVAYLGAETSANKDQDVRRALAPLAAMLERTDAACLCVRHLNKAAGGSPLYRGGGSIGIIGAARIGLLIAKDPDDDEARILAPIKGNLSKLAPALRFRLEDQPELGTARVVWDAAPVDVDASALLAATLGDAEERSALHEAMDFLRDYLSLGPRPVGDVFKEARPEHREVTLKRAKARLGVQSKREGFGPGSRVLWYLPDYPPYDAEAAAVIPDHAPDPVCTSDHAPRNDPVCRNPHNHAENGHGDRAETAIPDHPREDDPVWGDDPVWPVAAAGNGAHPGDVWETAQRVVLE